MDDQLHNFDKNNDSEINSLGSPYDFDSIMHYSRNTFAKNDFLDTILPINNHLIKEFKRQIIGQRLRLSKQDIIQTNLLYNCPVNGKTIFDSIGSIDFNEDLEINKTKRDEFYYEWRLVASSLSEHARLIIEELNFNNFNNFNCNENHLLILDGYQLKSPILKKICANTVFNLPIEINSKTNRLMIIYKKSKENKLGNLKFKINYKFLCGTYLTSKTGILQSNNYPLEYPSTSTCKWTIKAPNDHKILLNFIRFDLENSSNCTRDYLEIREGLNESNRLIGRFCGSYVPNRLQSTSNELYLKFVSDDSNSKTGFNITYATDLDECEKNLHDCDQLCINQLNGYRCDCLIGYELSLDGRTCLNSCGGLIKIEDDKNQHFLTSPGYPNNYENYLNCRWQITSPENYDIYFNFTDFDLEDNTNCLSDVLTIKSKIEKDNSFINHGRFCGERLPKPILSKSNTVLVDFKSKLGFF